MLWGSFSFCGVGSIMSIESVMNLDKHNVVIEKVVPDMRRAFPDGGGIFQQGLSLCVSSKKVKTISGN